jgi:hypothetical protein
MSNTTFKEEKDSMEYKFDQALKNETTKYCPFCDEKIIPQLLVTHVTKCKWWFCHIFGFSHDDYIPDTYEQPPHKKQRKLDKFNVELVTDDDSHDTLPKEKKQQEVSDAPKSTSAKVTLKKTKASNIASSQSNDNSDGMQIISDDDERDCDVNKLACPKPKISTKSVYLYIGKTIITLCNLNHKDSAIAKTQLLNKIKKATDKMESDTEEMSREMKHVCITCKEPCSSAFQIGGRDTCPTKRWNFCKKECMWDKIKSTTVKVWTTFISTSKKAANTTVEQDFDIAELSQNVTL